MSAINTQINVEAAVFANNTWIELTQFITKFSHHMSNVQNSNASITLNSEHMNFKLDDFDFLANGQTVVFRYGYLNEEGILDNLAQSMSKRYVAIIGDINYQYGTQGSKFILKLVSKGYFAKKVVAEKIWKNVTAQQIALTVAKIHDLKPFVDATSFQYQSLPQGNMSNFDLLKKLAMLEDGFVFFMRSNELHFKRVATHDRPIYTLDVDGKILKDLNLVWQDIEDSKKINTFFNDNDGFSTRETLKTTQAIGEGLLSTVQGLLIDENNGQILGGITKEFKQRLEDKNKTSETNRGDDASTMKKITDGVLDFVDAGTNTFLTTGKKVMSQVENTAQKELGFLSDALKVTRKELTGTATIVGVPFLTNDKTIYLDNIHSRFTGVYYIEEVTHRIEEKYTTTMRLNRHGIRRLDENPDVGSFSGNRSINPFENKEEPVNNQQSKEAALIDENGTLQGGVSNSKTNIVSEKDLPQSEK